MDGIWSRTCAVLTLACVAALCAAAPALATDGYVKGKKWHDLNANGVKDAGEPVVKDWWIYVDVDRDGVHDTGEPQAKTDASGNYAITGIKWWAPNHEPRTYDVREKPVSSQPQPLDGCSYPAGCKHTLTFKDSDHLFAGKDFGNYEKGKLIVKKVNVGGDPADAFAFTTSGAGLSDFSLSAAGGAKEFGSLKPGTYRVAEAADPDYTLTKAECSDGSDPAAIKVASGATVTCTFTNTRKAGLTVTKTEGGSTTLSRAWTFTLSGGPGQVDLTRSTADGNPMDFGTLLPGQYTLCEVGLPAGWHSSLGTATDGTVCTPLTLGAGERGTFAVDNSTPGIQLLKQVRRAGDAAWQKQATLQVGQTAEYLLTVTNAGVGPLVDVDVADDRCDADPAYAGGDADDDGELDETEAWTYRCDHVVGAGDGAEYVNTAEASATDKRENPVRDTDTATVKVTTAETPEPPVTPQPPTGQPSAEQEVLGEEVISGAARLRGPSGCVSRRFTASVRGRQIARVTFFVDGRQVKRVDAKRGQRVFKLGITPTRFGKGIHRVTAKVVFATASGTKARTLRLSFQRCARQVLAPRFTG